MKPIDVDDVPIVTFTLTSGSRDNYELRLSRACKTSTTPTLHTSWAAARASC